MTPRGTALHACNRDLHRRAVQRTSRFGLSPRHSPHTARSGSTWNSWARCGEICTPAAPHCHHAPEHCMDMTPPFLLPSGAWLPMPGTTDRTGLIFRFTYSFLITHALPTRRSALPSAAPARRTSALHRRTIARIPTAAPPHCCRVRCPYALRSGLLHAPTRCLTWFGFQRALCLPACTPHTRERYLYGFRRFTQHAGGVRRDSMFVWTCDWMTAGSFVRLRPVSRDAYPAALSRGDKAIQQSYNAGTVSHQGRAFVSCCARILRALKLVSALFGRMDLWRTPAAFAAHRAVLRATPSSWRTANDIVQNRTTAAPRLHYSFSRGYPPRCLLSRVHQGLMFCVRDTCQHAPCLNTSQRYRL